MRLWVFLHARWFDSSSFFLSNELFTKVQFLLSQPLWRFKDDAISLIFHPFLCPCLCLTQTLIHHTCNKESIVLACFITKSDYEFIHEIQNLPLTCVDYPTIPRVSTNPIKCQLPLKGATIPYMCQPPPTSFNYPPQGSISALQCQLPPVSVNYPQ